MITVLITIACTLTYLTGGLQTLIWFVADDLAHYWKLGEEYTEDDLTSAIWAGAVRALFWPLGLLMLGFRAAIRHRAYRVATKLWHKRGDKPGEVTGFIEAIEAARLDTPAAEPAPPAVEPDPSASLGLEAEPMPPVPPAPTGRATPVRRLDDIDTQYMPRHA